MCVYMYCGMYVCYVCMLIVLYMYVWSYACREKCHMHVERSVIFMSYVCVLIGDHG